MYSCMLAVGHFVQECVWVSRNCGSKVRGSAGNKATGRGLQQEVWQMFEVFSRKWHRSVIMLAGCGVVV